MWAHKTSPFDPLCNRHSAQRSPAAKEHSASGRSCPSFTLLLHFLFCFPFASSLLFFCFWKPVLIFSCKLLPLFFECPHSASQEYYTMEQPPAPPPGAAELPAKRPNGLL